MNDEVKVTVIATGFEEAQHQKEKVQQRRTVKMVDLNTYLNSREPARRMAAGGENLTLESVLAETDLDIPTFLRRKVEAR